MEHYKRPFYWVMGGLLLLTGLVYYLSADVSHDIDEVRVWLQRVPEDGNPAFIHLHARTADSEKYAYREGRPIELNDSRQAGVKFEHVPQGDYRILVQSQKCSTAVLQPGTPFAHAVRDYTYVDFAFVVRERWRKPHRLDAIIDLEQCTFALEFSRRPTWKWGF